MELISDEYCTFKTGCFKGVTNGYLGQLMQSKGRMDTQCIMGLRTLIEMMLEDEDIAEFIFAQPAPTLQSSRFTDWFYPYAEYLKQQTLNAIKNT